MLPPSSDVSHQKGSVAFYSTSGVMEVKPIEQCATLEKDSIYLILRPNIIDMSRLVISEEARSEDLESIALALNEVVRLPVTMRGSKYPGVRVELGRVLDKNYSGPVLEEVLRTGKAKRAVPDSGAYQGVPVSVAPIVVEGRAVAAVGVVDVIGTIDIPEVFGNYVDVVRQVARPGTERNVDPQS